MGRTRATDFVLVCEIDGGGIFCQGIYKSAEAAYGNMLLNIMRDAEAYQGRGSEFSMDVPYLMDENSGVCCEVTYKDGGWDKTKKDIYYVLFSGEEPIADEEPEVKRL